MDYDHHQFYPVVMKNWVVMLMENGQPLPASRPRVYGSPEQAWTVARKMAAEHMGSTFAVYETTSAHVADPRPQPPVVSINM